MSTEQTPNEPASDLGEDDLSTAFTDALSGQDSQPAVPESPAASPTSAEPEAPAALDPSPASAPIGAPVETSPNPAAPQQEAPSNEPQISDSLRHLLTTAEQYGVSTDGMTSEAQLTEAVLQQMRQMQPYVQFAHQAMPHVGAVRDAYVSGQSPEGNAPPQGSQAAPAPADSGAFDASKYLNEKYGGPSWKPEYQTAVDTGIVHRDPETGLWKPVPGYEVMAGTVVADMNAAQQHSSSFWQGIAQGNPYDNFYNVLKEPLMHDFRALIEETIEGREKTTRSQDVVSRFEEEHASWLYQVNPQTGERLPTEKGSQFLAAVSDLRESGITDPEKAIGIASRMLGVGTTQSPAPAQQQAATTAQAPAQQPVAQPPATPQPPAPQQTPTQQAFLDSALQRAAHSPTATGGIAPDQPQSVTEGDLESMFTSALRANSGPHA